MATKDQLPLYSVADLLTFNREDLLTFKGNVNEALAQSEENAMKDIKAKLEAAGIDAKEFAKFMGVQVGGSTGGGSTSSAGKKNADPKIEAFKTKYNGKWIINPGTDNGGKDFLVGGRGSFASWVSDKIEDIEAGKLDVMTDEEYLKTPAGLVVAAKRKEAEDKKAAEAKK